MVTAAGRFLAGLGTRRRGQRPDPPAETSGERQQPFWERKTLAEMTHAEWESCGPHAESRKARDRLDPGFRALRPAASFSHSRQPVLHLMIEEYGVRFLLTGKQSAAGR